MKNYNYRKMKSFFCCFYLYKGKYFLRIDFIFYHIQHVSFQRFRMFEFEIILSEKLALENVDKVNFWLFSCFELLSLQFSMNFPLSCCLFVYFHWKAVWKAQHWNILDLYLERGKLSQLFCLSTNRFHFMYEIFEVIKAAWSNFVIRRLLGVIN